MKQIGYQELFDRVCSLTELATFASSLGTILGITRDPAGTSKQLAAAVARDPVLSMKLLRTVNSCFFALDREIETVEDAVVVLGFSEVERIAVAISVIHQFGAKTKKGMILQQLWNHSLVAAVAAETLVQFYNVRSVSANDMYIAALLHDIGKAVLWQFFPKAAKCILDATEQQGATAHEVELEILDGATHGLIGAWVAGNWALPLQTVQGIQMHHTPLDAPPGDESPRIVCVADSLCYRVSVPATKSAREIPQSAFRPSAFLEGNDAFMQKFKGLWEAKRKMIESVTSAG